MRGSTVDVQVEVYKVIIHVFSTNERRKIINSRGGGSSPSIFVKFTNKIWYMYIFIVLVCIPNGFTE